MLHIVWRFRARPQQLQEFMRYYNPKGIWTELFRKSSDYHGTVMLQDIADPLGFLIEDRWTNNSAVTHFREDFGREYDELDRHCESLTQEEHLVGIYEDKEF